MAITQISLPMTLLNSVNPNQNTSSIQSGIGSITDKDQPAKSEFANFLDDALQKMDGLQKGADAATLQLATGQIQDVHSAMIALEKANLGFTLAVEVRNKVLDAYHEAMRMQL